MHSIANRYQLTSRLWLGTALLWLSLAATLAVGLWGLHAARSSLTIVHDARLVTRSGTCCGRTPQRCCA